MIFTKQVVISISFPAYLHLRNFVILPWTLKGENGFGEISWTPHKYTLTVEPPLNFYRTRL